MVSIRSISGGYPLKIHLSTWKAPVHGRKWALSKSPEGVLHGTTRKEGTPHPPPTTSWGYEGLVDLPHGFPEIWGSSIKNCLGWNKQPCTSACKRNSSSGHGHVLVILVQLLHAFEAMSIQKQDLYLTCRLFVNFESMLVQFLSGMCHLRFGWRDSLIYHLQLKRQSKRLCP